MSPTSPQTLIAFLAERFSNKLTLELGVVSKSNPLEEDAEYRVFGLKFPELKAAVEEYYTRRGFTKNTGLNQRVYDPESYTNTFHFFTEQQRVQVTCTLDRVRLDTVTFLAPDIGVFCYA